MGLFNRRPAGQPEFVVDGSALQTYYANDIQIIQNRREVVLESRLTADDSAAPALALGPACRVVLNYYTAKRLVLALQQAVREHEVHYGTIESDEPTLEMPHSRAGAFQRGPDLR
jgi:hypothetical protein